MTKINELSFINKDAINFNEYNALFEKIRKSNTAKQLDEIAKDYKLDLVSTKYPRLEFNISKNEIEDLKNTGILSNTGKDEFLSVKQNNLNPITKLLFALAWKQGDLQKLKLIIKGIEEAKNPKLEKPEGLVFYCFGNHLANHIKYPIIDQHVIRAFNLYNDNSKCNFTRKSDKVTLIDRDNYLKWFKEFKSVDSDFLYLLDRILFEIGKAVKMKKNSNT